MNDSSLAEADDKPGIPDCERQILAATLIVSAIVGAVGNSLVIVAVGLSNNLRTATNAFVVSLAVADFTTCLFTPWQAVAILTADDWPIPGVRWVCTMADFVVVITIGCSVNNLALIAINRWVGITKSCSTTRRIYTSHKIALMVIFAWIVPLLLALTPVVADFGELSYAQIYRTSSSVRSNPHKDTYALLIASIFYPIQFTIIISSYISIFCYVRKTSNDTIKVANGNEAMRKTISKRQIDVTKNLLYVVLAFIVCLTPYFIALINSEDWSYRLGGWGAVILVCNSSVNPFIYAVSHPDFKEAFRYMKRCQKIPRSGAGRRNRPTKDLNSPKQGEPREHGV
ncbi:melanopsin-like [Acanthaster planci]|uniref:Melanopsin-like n=1 Tax=Acanthaster planci TaxID=133434 RepID=A0A8B7Z091_ACAPL|nr:melanopsin-like [Acanthaster planci]